MEGTTAGEFDIDVGVYREYPYAFDKAAQDLFTYGPLDIVKKMLLYMDLKGYVKACGMNPRLREICRDPKFKREYFGLHEKEVLDGLKLTLYNPLTDSGIAFYKEWSVIAGDKWDPSFQDNGLLRMAIKRGLFKNVKFILEGTKVNPAANDNDALMEAIRLGHWEIVELFLSDRRVDPSINGNEAIYEAVVSEGNSLMTVKALLKDSRVNPSDPENDALKRAIEEGDSVKIVKVLLEDPRTDPTVNNHSILYMYYRGVLPRGEEEKKMLDLVKKWYKDHKIPIPKPKDLLKKKRGKDRSRE